jgi:hypothetical protein
MTVARWPMIDGRWSSLDRKIITKNNTAGVGEFFSISDLDKQSAIGHRSSAIGQMSSVI